MTIMYSISSNKLFVESVIQTKDKYHSVASTAVGRLWYGILVADADIDIRDRE